MKTEELEERRWMKRRSSSKCEWKRKRRSEVLRFRRETTGDGRRRRKGRKNIWE